MSLRRLLALAIATLGLVAGPALAQAPGGKTFNILTPPQPTDGGGKIEVIEFFWYGCGHCHTLEPFIEAWLRTAPKDVVFKRVPAIPSEAWAQMAVMYYAFEAMGQLDTMHKKVFDAYHNEGVILSNRKVRDEWLAKQGVDVSQFTAVERSFAVQSKLSRARQLTAAYKIEGVPTIFVNGKYYTSPGAANGAGRVMGVVDEMIALSRRELGLTEAPKPAPAKK